jgi:hypothetical protein
MQDQYTKEQIKEVQEREKKALEYLKENHLSPAAVVQKVRVGDDMFVDKVTPYLRDTRYASVESPIKNDELSKKD